MFAFGWNCEDVSRHQMNHKGVANLVALDVVKSISVREMLCNSALAASCWTSDDEDVVMGRNDHLAGLGLVQNSDRLGWRACIGNWRCRW